MAVNVGAIEATVSLKDKMSVALKRVSGNLGKLEGGMSRMSTSASGLGRSLTMGLTAPLVAIGGGAIKAAIDFETSFTGVRKTVDATEEEFQALSDAFRKMAREIPISVNELNRIGEAAGQLGIEKENIVDFTRTMADLGVTTNMSADDAATALARFANITGMAQDDFDKLGSVIVGLGNSFATTEGEIVEMGLRLAGAGAQIGMTQAEIMGMAAALSSVGIRAEAGGTAMSRVMIDIATSVAKGGKQLELYGETAGMSAEAFARLFSRDSAGAMVKFVQGLSDVSDEGAAVFTVLEDMGLANIRTRDALLRSAGAAEMFSEAMGSSNDLWNENAALTDEAEKRYATVASQLQLLWNRINDVAVELGMELMPIFSDMVDMVKGFVPRLKDMIQGFREMSPLAKKLSVSFAAIAAVSGPGLVFLGSIGSLATGIIATAGAVKGLAVSIGLAHLASLGLAGLGLGAIVAGGTILWKKHAAQVRETERRYGLAEGSVKAFINPFRSVGEIAADMETPLGNASELLYDLEGNLVLNAAAVKALEEGTVELNDSQKTALGTGGSLVAVMESQADAVVEVEEATDNLVTTIKKLTEEQQKIVETWARGAIPAALDYMAALEEIGGLSKLSAKEQSDLNTSLEAALVDYRLLGQEAPAAMRAIAAETRKVLEATPIDFPLLQLGDARGGWKRQAQALHDDLQAGLDSRGGIVIDIVGGLDGPEMVTTGQRLGQLFKQGFTGIIEGIPQTLVDAFTGGGGLMGAFKAISSRVGSFLGKTLGDSLGKSLAGLGKKIGGKMGGLLGGIAGMAGPFGAAIGALAGPLIGGLKRLFGKPSVAESVRKASGKMFGKGISEGLSEAIEETRADVGSDFGAMMMHLSSIMEEQGGVMAMGLDKAIRAVRDIFSAVEQGAITTEQAAETFGTSFSMIADALVESGDVASAEFVELIRLAEAFGTTAETIKFVGEQSRIASQGLAAMFGPTIETATALNNEIEATRQRLDGLTEGTDAYNETQVQLNSLLDEQADLAGKSQGELEDIGLIAVASFQAALAAGMSFTDAVKANGPAIDAVIEAQEQLGITTDDVALRALANFQKRVSENSTLVAGVEALDDTMLALSRTGALNAETLGAMERQGVRMYEELIAKGFSQREAIMMMGPALKSIADAHAALGIPIDETTQALIDQATEAGTLETQQTDGWGRIEAAIMLVVGEIQNMIGALGGAKDAVDDIPKEVTVRGRVNWETGTIPTPPGGFEADIRTGRGSSNPPRGPHMQHGGIVTSPTTALIGEAGPEAVIPLDQLSDRDLLEELQGIRSDLRNLPLMLRDALILAQ